jgi:hypothetical protein
MRLVGSESRLAYSRERNKTVTDRGCHDDNGHIAQRLQVYSSEYTQYMLLIYALAAGEL